MATADFGLSSFLDQVPQLDVGGLLPSNPLTPTAQQQPLVPNAPAAQVALASKYSTYMQQIKPNYDPMLIQAMMDFDSQRVRNGQAPLNQDQTIKSLDSAKNKQPATPVPKRGISPIDILSNASQDIGDIIKSIPRIPTALVHEVEQLGTIGDSISQGPNLIAGLLRAPGIRLIPGSYTLGNLAAGEPGEILRHPVQTLLDVLPGANELAKTSEVAKATHAAALDAILNPETTTLSTREFRKLDRLRERPIGNVILNQVGPDGGIIRNPMGEIMDVVRASKIGKFLTGHFGIDARDMAALMNGATGRLDAMLQGKIQPTTDLEAIAKTAHDFRETLKGMDPSLLEHGRISAIYDASIYDNYTGLSDTELGAAQAYRSTVLEPLTEWALRNNKNVELGGEIYDKQTGSMLMQHQRNLDLMKTMNTMRGAVVDADHATALDTLVGQLSKPGKLPGMRGRLSAEQRIASMRAGEVGARELLSAWQGTRQTLRNAGFDTTILDQLAQKSQQIGGRSVATGGGITTPAFIKAVKDLQAGRIELPTQATMSPSEVMAYAKEHIGDSIGYRDLERGVTLNEWKGVTKALDNLRPPDPPAEFTRGVRNFRDTARLMDKPAFKSATDDGLVRAQQTLDRAKERNLPARFQPKQKSLTRDILKPKLIGQQEFLPFETAWDAERIIAAVDKGEMSDIPGFSQTMYSTAQREAGRTVMRLKEAGFDPVFIHTVTPNRVESSLRFGENIVHSTEASTRARVIEGAPGIKDMTLAANDMAMQFLDEPLREAQLHMVADQFGYTQAEVNAMTHETARYRAGKSSVLDYEGHKTQVINEKFMQLNPDELGQAWGSPYLNKLRDDKIFVPKQIGNQLKDMTKSGKFLGGVLDPTTKLFRISTTALSLRTQLYNLVGGPISATLLHPDSLKYSARVLEMLKDRTLIPEDMQAVVGSNVRTMHELDDISKGKVVEGVRQYMVGEKMRKWWDQVQANKVIGRDLSGRFGGKFQGLIEKSYQMNGFVDDFTRLITYFSEHDRQIRLGMPAEYAAFRGVGVARKVLQDFLGQTPFERNIMKSILPFYGFMSHAMRFVLRFPFDHPLRAEFIAKLTEAELEDNNQGLPSRFMAMLFFGHPDKVGNQHTLNLGPFNPFGDVANQMTLAGFLGNTNPVLQTMFEMVGLQQGTSELYPSLRYDPETGRMVAQHPGLLETVAGNIIPSSTGILAMMGMNSQYNDIMRRDPEAGGRYLLSSLTFPTIERQYNVPQEQFAAEMARQKSQDSVLQDALKSGDWSEAMRYPTLGKYLEAVSHISPDQIAPYQTQPKATVMNIAQSSFNQQPITLPKVPKLSALVSAQQAMIGTNPPGSTGLPSAPPVSGLAVGGALGLNGI